MIKDIILYRRKGMSFRKIAEKLNSTIGKVQYQWLKYGKENQNERIDIKNESNDHITQKTTIDNDYFLVNRLDSPNKLTSYWKIADWQKEMTASYFNNHINQGYLILRLYDVTDILFNGSNAHSMFEFQIPLDKTSWSIKGLKPSRSYITEIGYRLNNQQFFPILRSNALHGNLTCVNDHDTEVRLPEKNLYPSWNNRVSTYSYYENINKVEDEDGQI